MALSPDQRRRLLRMNMLMSYAAFASSKAVAWTPATLFANAEVGGWYDPSDLTTMFQDAAGTTAASLESPVGLVLDKSKGPVLGSELVTNGDFSNGSTGWTLALGWTVSGGQLVGTVAASGNYATSPSFTVTAGRWYKITFTTTVTSGTYSVRFDTFGNETILGTVSASGNYTFYVAAPDTSTVIAFRSLGGFSGTIDNVSVKELPGNHLSQSTSTARPVLSARVNLLTRTEELSNGAAWVVQSGSSVDPNTHIAPDGTQTADTVSSTGTTEIYQGLTTVSGVSYRASLSIRKTSSATRFPLLAFNGSAAFGQVILNTNTGVASVRSGVSGATDIVVTDQTDYWRLSYLFTPDTTSCSFRIYPSASSDGTTVSGSSAGSIVAWGVDIRPSNAGVGLPAYQRVGAATSGSSSSAGTADYDATGFPYYLKGDGVDDHLLGPNIGNLITVSDYEACVGARFNVVTTNSSQWLNQSLVTDNAAYVGIGAAKSTGFVGAFNFDTNADEATVAMVAPATIVLQQRHTGGNVIISTNGGSEASATSGNTGSVSNPMQVLKAFGAVYTNGHIYGIVIRQTPFTAGERASIRDWMNSKTKAF